MSERERGRERERERERERVELTGWQIEETEERRRRIGFGNLPKGE